MGLVIEVVGIILFVLLVFAILTASVADTYQWPWWMKLKRHYKANQHVGRHR